MDAYTDTCVPAYDGCDALTGENAACLSAGSACASAVETPIEQANNFGKHPSPPISHSETRKVLPRGAN